MERYMREIFPTAFSIGVKVFNRVTENAFSGTLDFRICSNSILFLTQITHGTYVFTAAPPSTCKVEVETPDF